MNINRIAFQHIYENCLKQGLKNQVCWSQYPFWVLKEIPQKDLPISPHKNTSTRYDICTTCHKNTFPFSPPENTSTSQVLQRLSYCIEKWSYKMKRVVNNKTKNKIISLLALNSLGGRN